MTKFEPLGQQEGIWDRQPGFALDMAYSAVVDTQPLDWVDHGDNPKEHNIIIEEHDNEGGMKRCS